MPKKKKVASVAAPVVAKPLVESHKDADEKIAKTEGQISAYIDKMRGVSIAEGLFEPKVKAITETSESLAACLKHRAELIAAKSELKD